MTDRHDPVEALGVLSRGLLARNAIYNIVALGLPLVAGAVAVPFLIAGLGTEGFGVLTLVWMVVGYLGLFDMSIGRATTKFAAEFRASGRTEAIAPVVWTSLLLSLAIGLVAAALLAAVTPWLMGRALRLSPHLVGDARAAMYLLAAALPFVLGAGTPRGVLEAHQRFGVLSAIKIPSSIAMFVSPLLVLPFSRSLTAVVGALVLTRVLALAAYLYCALGSVPGAWRPRWPDPAYMKPLAGVGGWMTVTSLVGTLVSMGYIDRLVIGRALSLDAVAYYIAPLEVITKVLLLPIGLLGVLFPAFCVHAAGEVAEFSRLRRHALACIAVAVGPFVAVTIAFSEPFLDAWLGREFAVQGTAVLRLLALGVFVRALALVPFTTLHAVNRADLMAAWYVIGAGAYVPVLWFAVGAQGILGAALVWLAWAVVEAVALFGLEAWVLPSVRGRPARVVAALAVGWGVLFALAHAVALLPGFVLQAAMLGVLLGGVAVIAWRRLFDEPERRAIRAVVLRLAPSTRGGEG